MTAIELISSLQEIGEENLGMEVEHYDEYRYVLIESIHLFEDNDYSALTGNWEYKL